MCPTIATTATTTLLRLATTDSATNYNQNCKIHQSCWASVDSHQGQGDIPIAIDLSRLRQDLWDCFIIVFTYTYVRSAKIRLDSLAKFLACVGLAETAPLEICFIHSAGFADPTGPLHPRSFTQALDLYLGIKGGCQGSMTG